MDTINPSLPQRPAPWPAQAPPAFHLLSKPTGAICNLDCAYCFFLAKELLYPGSRFHMADELLENYIRQLIEAHQTPEVTIAWQGGEPTLMGLDFFKRSIKYARKYACPDQSIQHTIQTNGTLLNDEWAAFFKEHHFLVGISIDGLREMHDVYRTDKGGAPTFDKVMRGLSFLKNHRVDWNALVTLNRSNVDHPIEVYRFLRDECGATSPQSTCRCSMSRWRIGTASRRACASSRKHAAWRWRWSTTAISIHAIISLSRSISWATSARRI
jgi:uncharacterized protein